MSTPDHSTFDLSHDWKGSFKAGELVPVYVTEVLPSDRFSGSADAFFRLMPLMAPIMHRLEGYFHAFYVPNRLLWPNWNIFWTGGQMGTVTPQLPTLGGQGENITPSSLQNYMGIPVMNNNNHEYSALPFAAYQRIWYDWYRDQNLQNVGETFPWMLQDGSNNTSMGGHHAELVKIRNRAWGHDYLTSALPFPQKGASVGLPIDFTGAQIMAIAPVLTGGFNPLWRFSSTGAAATGNAGAGGSISHVVEPNSFGSTIHVPTSANNTPNAGAYYDPQGTLVIAGTVSATIDDLRTTQALQRWLEKNARGGSREVEALRVHFGVRSSDARLDRAEYLGGSKTIMGISEVLQTSSTISTGVDASPLGHMAGHGSSVSGGRLMNYQAEEHGILMIIMSFRPTTSYFQGIPRWMMKNDRFDYVFKEFCHLGEQEVFNYEVCATGNIVADTGTFGYMPRYGEYRSQLSRCVGQMATTLDFWHYGRKFTVGSVVPLNEQFITCKPDKRIFVNQNPADDEMIGHIVFKIFARRPLPMYGTPI